jgi:fatty-acyl-CoA synthase
MSRSMLSPTETDCRLPRRYADFSTILAALNYASGGVRGLNFYSGRGQLADVLTYRDLREQAETLARKLLRSGLSAGERVGLIAQTDADFVRALFGCQMAGLIPVPLPLPVAFSGRDAYVGHLRRLLTSADASAAFASPRLAPALEQAAEGLGFRMVGPFSLLETVPETGPDLRLPDEDAIAYLQFSSGSTRFPLGVAVTHRALMQNARAIASHGLVVRDGDRGTSWLPLYHDMGMVGFLLTPLAAQVSVDFLPSDEFARRPLLWLNLISANHSTLSYAPSVGYELCVRRGTSGLTAPIDLSSWRAAGIGGDMIRPAVLEQFADTFAPSGFDRKAFVASYGMAEATLAISFAPLGSGVETDTVDLTVLETEGRAVLPPAGAPGRHFVLCGKPLPGHEIEIRDDRGLLRSEGAVGRIFLRGPSLMRTYFEHPEETAAILSSDGWLDTGDLGYWRRGALVITGRAKDLIIVNGRNIWPQDIEWTAERVDGLRSGDVAAFGLDDPAAEKIAVLVQSRLSDPERRAVLEKDIRGLIMADHGVDAQVVLVPPRSLPRTSSGKLSRNKARTMLLEGAFGAKE